MLAVSFRNVTKAYGGRPVFTGLSAEVPEGGVTFVVGRSGEGKSVLCRMAVGLERPDEGEVLLFGEPIQHLRERQLLPLRKKAPYLVQGPALLDWLSVAQNVALANPGGADEEVRQALERVGVEQYADRRPTELGPGIRKRAAIARALVQKPRFLLFDEPTTGLDRAAARQVSEVLEALRGEGLGAMVVSHDYPLLERMADRVLLVARHTARMFGSASEFLSSQEAQVGRHG